MGCCETPLLRRIATGEKQRLSLNSGPVLFRRVSATQAIDSSPEQILHLPSPYWSWVCLSLQPLSIHTSRLVLCGVMVVGSAGNQHVAQA